MLTTNLSGFAIFVILIVMFVFRRTIKTITRETPEAASIVVSHITDTVRVNALEDKLEQQDTLAAIQRRMQDREWISAKALMTEMENCELQAQNPQPQQQTNHNPTSAS